MDVKQSTERGWLIVFEGLDRCGKTTQCGLLAEDLVHNLGMFVRQMRFPDRETETGKKISAYLNNTLTLTDMEVHNLFAANRREKMDEMHHRLLGGETLIVDRYAFSGVAYTAAKGYDIEECKKADVGHLRPDVVVFIDVPVSVLQTRYGTEKYEKQEFQEKVLLQYNKLFDVSYWIHINGAQQMKDVQRDIKVAVLHQLSCDQSLHYLWPQNSTPILVNCTPHEVTVCGHKLPTLCTQSIRLEPACRYYVSRRFGLKIELDNVSVAELRCTTPQVSASLIIPDDLRKYWDDPKTYTLVVSAMAAKYIVENHLRINIAAMDTSPTGVVRDAGGQIVGTTALELY